MAVRKIKLSAEQSLNNLANALVEDILALSDEEVLAEVIEDGKDPEEIAQKMHELFEQTKDQLARREQLLSAKDIIYRWSAGEVCFDCPCGEVDIQFTEAGDRYICRCGRIYVLVHHVACVEKDQ